MQGISVCDSAAALAAGTRPNNPARDNATGGLAVSVICIGIIDVNALILFEQQCLPPTTSAGNITLRVVELSLMN